MNKTVSVNIGGRVFNIEEHAYDKLSRYIQAIRSYFAGNDSADEIVSDIELRIAELFLERLGPSKQVITMSDVSEVIAIMGQPEEFAGEGDEQEASAKTGFDGNRYRKRVFRDPDNRVLAGVCSGISAYFGWDPIVLRAIFLITFFTTGLGLLLYIVLALIIPKANTTAEKLQMRGEPVTVENISRKVSESVDDLKEDVKDFGRRNNISEDGVRNFGERLGDFFRDLFDALGRFLKGLFIAIGKLLGIAFFIGSLFIVFALLLAFLGVNTWFLPGMSELPFGMSPWSLLTAQFPSASLKYLFIFGLIATVLIPVIALFLLGVRLLFGRKASTSGAATVVLVVIWFVGISVLTVASLKLAEQFRVEAAVSDERSLEPPSGNMLVVDSWAVDHSGATIKIRRGKKKIFRKGDVTFPFTDSTDVMYIGKTRFTVAMNTIDSTYRLETERSALGATYKDAVRQAELVEARTELSGDTLKIFPWYSSPGDGKIRAQEVNYTLYVPQGKRVHFGRHADAVLSDVPNVTNTFDRDMVNKTWIMTDRGLSCLSCP